MPRFSITIDPKTYQKLQEDARKNERSTAAQVRHIVKQHYDQQPKPNDKK